MVTLTRLFLHWSQPLRDLVWVLRGRMFCGWDVHTIQQGGWLNSWLWWLVHENRDISDWRNIDPISNFPRYYNARTL